MSHELKADVVFERGGVKGIGLVGAVSFAEEIVKYSLIVTFNGKRFDLPFLR